MKKRIRRERNEFMVNFSDRDTDIRVTVLQRAAGRNEYSEGAATYQIMGGAFESAELDPADDAASEDALYFCAAGSQLGR
jgi:hypothetical protein